MYEGKHEPTTTKKLHKGKGIRIQQQFDYNNTLHSDLIVEHGIFEDQTTETEGMNNQQPLGSH